VVLLHSIHEVFGMYLVGILVHGMAFKLCIEEKWEKLKCGVIRMCTVTVRYVKVYHDTRPPQHTDILYRDLNSCARHIQ
jgi:hypothetical protein